MSGAIAELILMYLYVGLGVLLGQMAAVHRTGSQVQEHTLFAFFGSLTKFMVGWPLLLLRNHHDGLVNRRWRALQRDASVREEGHDPELRKGIAFYAAADPERARSVPYDFWLSQYVESLLTLADEPYREATGHPLLLHHVGLRSFRQWARPGRYRTHVTLYSSDPQVAPAVRWALRRIEQAGSAGLNPRAAAGE